MKPPLLITGVGRSGTTLAEKLLNSHQSICVGSQPFPDLYLGAKSAFLAERGVVLANPIDTWFPRAEGSLVDLRDFLERDWWSSERLDVLFEDMAGNSGQYMKSLLRAREMIRPGPFFDVYSALLEAMARELGCSECEWVGSKEVFLEELVSAVLDRGGAAVVVLRDPRDVLTSCLYGNGPDFVGSLRPTLFMLRQWRKSVAFAIHLRSRPRFLTVRYEDLISAPGETLNRIAHRLGVEPCFDQMDGAVLDQRGRVWAGNSSFGRRDGVRGDSIGGWKKYLDDATVRYVDTVCGPELDLMGYDRDRVKTGSVLEIIDGFVEPSLVRHPRFAPDYSTNDEAANVERRRLELLGGDVPTDAVKRQWFIFPEVYDVLNDPATHSPWAS